MRSWAVRVAPLMLVAVVAVAMLEIVLQAAAWLHLGIDVPWADEWNPYLLGAAGSFDPGYLLQPANQTLYPVGKILDAIAQHLLGGNIVAYETISMVGLLGALVVFQLKLLQRALASVALVAVALVLVLVMLRAGTYWGTSDEAYQQGLPLLCLIAIVWLFFARPRLLRRHDVVAATLAAIGGLSYISGAFADVAVGLALVVVGVCAATEERRRALRMAAVVLAAGVVTSAWQYEAVFTGTGQGKLAFPWTPQFWAYVAGLVGGSLWNAPDSSTDPRAGIAVAVAVVGLVAVVMTALAALVLLIRRRPIQIDANAVPITLFALTAGVFAYASLVAAARTYFEVPANVADIQIMLNGMKAHHPFWVSILWPWVAAFLFGSGALRVDGGTLAERIRGILRPTLISVVAIAVVVSSALAGSFDFGGYFAGIREIRAAMLDCLENGLNNNLELRCQGGRPDLDYTLPVLHAMTDDVSFTHYLRMVHSPPSSPALYDLAAAAASSYQLGGASLSANQGSSGLALDVSARAVVAIKTGQATVLKGCHILEVSATVLAPSPALIQVLWSPASAPSSPQVSAWRPTAQTPTEDHALWFYLVATDGFADSLRLVFTTVPQSLELRDLAVRCRYAQD